MPRLNILREIEYRISDGSSCYEWIKEEYDEMNHTDNQNDEDLHGIEKYMKLREKIRHSNFYDRKVTYKVKRVDQCYEDGIAHVLFENGKITRNDIKRIIYELDIDDDFDERMYLEMYLDWEDFINDMNNDLTDEQRYYLKDHILPCWEYEFDDLIDIAKEMKKLNIPLENTEFESYMEMRLNDRYDTIGEEYITVMEFNVHDLIVAFPSGKIVNLFKPEPSIDTYNDEKQRLEYIKKNYNMNYVFN